MAMDDLFTALKMFQDGVQTLQTQRAITSANEQVNQIKAAEGNEMQKRSMLQNLSNQLVGHLAGLGAPATTIEQVKGTIAPKQFANANQMFMESQLTGDSNLAGAAQKQSDFENNPKYAMTLMKAQMKADPMRQMQFDALQAQRFTKEIDALDKRLDPQTSRFGNMAQLQGVNNTIRDARALLQGDIYNLNIAEVAKTLDRILSRAAPTMAGTEHVTPKTLEQLRAKTMEYVTSSPSKVNIPEFVSFYKKTLDRIEGINTDIIKEAQRNVIRGRGDIAKMNPEAFSEFVRQKLPGEDAVVDPKSGKVNFQSDLDHQDKLKQALEMAVQNPNAQGVDQFLEQAKQDKWFKVVLKSNPKLAKSFQALRRGN